LQVLGLGAFLQHMLNERGLEALELFYRQARAGSFRRKFREAMGTSLSRAEAGWRKELPASHAAVMANRDASPPPPGATMDLLRQGEASFLARQDVEAERLLRQVLETDPNLARAHLLLARIAFRAGRDREAQEHARQALLVSGDDPVVAAWAQVTLGRAHAARGELQAARLELTDPAVAAGPDEPRVLADYWLESLGMSPSRAAAARYLSQQAEIDLQRYNWEDAEKRVLRILAADPGNVDAHHQLARIRLNKYQYWYDFTILYNELFPGTTPSDPEQYHYLAESSRRESLKGMLLASGEYTPMDLELGESLDGGPSPRPSGGSAVTLPPAGMGGGQHRQHFLRAEGYYLAGDWKRAASNLKAILGMSIPVSNFRALVLFRLGFCEQQMELWDDARSHLEEANEIVRNRGMQTEIQRLLELQAGKKARTGPRDRKP
jgi:tetratricopeptide (TPR) repeat protein